MARGTASRRLGTTLLRCLEDSLKDRRLSSLSSTASTSARGLHTKPPGPKAGNPAWQKRGNVMPAQQEVLEPEFVHRLTGPAAQTQVDAFGAVSVLAETDESVRAGVYRNLDGYRQEDGRYAAFVQEISSFIPGTRQFTDPVRTFAYGTDASFYRLNPKLVVKVHSEEEVARILPIARKHQVPVTFRAAGTSLSGQAITDSVLLKLSHTGRNFRNYEIHVRPVLCGCSPCFE